MKLKITVDKNKCIGSANCVVIAPNSFELDENGKSQPIHEVTAENIEEIYKAVAACPVSAISVEQIDD